MSLGKVVNLYGGPGAGKSTLAANLYSALKRKHVNVEYVNEFAKEMVYENNVSVLNNQILVFAMQFHKLLTACEHNDIVITDSPLLLSTIYNPDTSHNLYSLVVEMYHKFTNLDVYVVRSKHPHNKSGRIHSLTESLSIDNRIKHLLSESLGIDYLTYSTEDEYHSHKFDSLMTLIQQEFGV